MKNNTTSIIISILLVASLLALVDPFMYWMPEKFSMLPLLIATVLLVLWSGFVMKEKTEDERDAVNRMLAGRIAYLSGIFTLTIALLVQGVSYAVDPWIAITLVVMVVAKLAARFWADENQ